MRPLTGLDGLVLALDDIALDMEEVPRLIQRITIAAEVRLGATVEFSQGVFDVAQLVSFG